MKKILISAAVILICALSNGQTRRMAVTGLSENMMRAKADYESALETQSLMGTIVEITAEDGYWRQVSTPEPYIAWCTNLGLVEMSPEQLDAYKAAPKYICTAMHSGVYARPSDKSPRLSDLSMGNLTRIIFKPGKSTRPSVKKKWAEVMLPDGRCGWTPAKDLAPFTEWAEQQEVTAEKIIKTALKFEGTPYLWGGASSKGLDCSGLVRLTFFMNGHLLPRNASQQVRYGDEVTMQCDHNIGPGSEGFIKEMTRRTQNLKPGDLVFFGSPATEGKKERITHVGIYIGDGKIIHASHKVRVNSLIPGSEDYYENSHRLLKARRFIGWKGQGMLPILESPAYFTDNSL